jgi:membrane protein implicated in regulation of membrane protease activity
MVIELWAIYVFIAIAAVIVEIFVPTLFCINFAVGAIITAVISIFWGNLAWTMLIFVLISLLSIFCLRPILVRMMKKESHADFNAQYIGKIVKCIEPISTTKGAVTIYEERWDARLKEEGEEIPVGTDVRITGNESLILFVEKV